MPSFERKYLIGTLAIGFLLVAATRSSVPGQEITYTASFSYKLGALKNIYVIQEAHSDIECAILCSQNPLCSTFYFDEAKHICNISDSVLTNAQYKVFGPQLTIVFPPLNGYEIYRINGILFYLMFSTTTLQRAGANNKCELSGGHVFKVENQAVFDCIVEILTLRYGPSYVMLIDGYHNLVDNRFNDYKGEPLTYMTAPDEHPTSALCLKIEDGQMRNLHCGTYTDYICQFGDAA